MARDVNLVISEDNVNLSCFPKLLTAPLGSERIIVANYAAVETDLSGEEIGAERDTYFVRILYGNKKM